MNIVASGVVGRTQGFRDAAADRLSGLAHVDVLILGGGINGVAVLRELALNGVSAALIDEGDFCQGATGASSRLAHGGLRYLENREFDLVAEAVRERGRLLRHAPHQVQPIRMQVPLRHRVRGFIGTARAFLGFSGKRSRLNALSLRLALLLYRFYGRGDQRLPDVHTRLRRAALPDGLAKDFSALISYHDACIVNPEGFVLELLEEALHVSSRAAAINHVSWTRLPDGSVQITDRLQPSRHWLVKPRLVVNATGAWVDQVNARLGLRSDHVTPVKGAHLIISNDALLAWLGGDAWYYDDGDGRMVICCPLAHTILIGTTEIPVTDPGDKTISDDEINYLLGALNRLTAGIGVERGQIVSTTVGCRPLQKVHGKDAYRANREHALHRESVDDQSLQVLSLVGGKWTTFRAFAELASDEVLAMLNHPRTVSTADRDYPGAARWRSGREAGARVAAPVSVLSPARVDALLRRYGAAGDSAVAFCSDQPDESLHTLTDYSVREIQWLRHHRGAEHVEDVMQRRTSIALDGRASDAVVAELSRLLSR